MYPLPLSPTNLTLPKEKTYFNLLAVFAGLLWLGIAISCVGLFYALLIGFGIWLANGLLVAHLRSEGVRVGADQYPELYATFREVLATFQHGNKEPSIYVVQSEGALNAFATRHSGRDFVVIYSSILDAYGPDSAEMRFLIGHEIGHIRSNHLLKRLFIAPAFFLPWLPPAYSRACEASCDRHGAFASGDADAAVSAMMKLAAGKDHAARMSAPVFAQQHHNERGFFVSWHELNSFYPTLSQRVSNLLAIKNGQFVPKPKRNPLAYLFTLVNFRTGMVVYLLIILGAIAVPSFQRARERAMQQKNAEMQKALEGLHESENPEAGSAGDQATGNTPEAAE